MVGSSTGVAPTDVTPTGDFRTQFAELAESAHRELLEKRENARARAVPKRISRILWIGGTLIFLQLGLLAIQLLHRSHIVAEKGALRPHPLLVASDCNGVKYRTYGAMQTYRRDRGEWPRSLGELVDLHYLVETPIDPATGTPLRYARIGPGFALDCPSSRR
jgi:hypothetical protein